MSTERSKKRGASQSDAVVGFEAKLWQMADRLRNNMDAAEYKHVVLGLIFLEYCAVVGRRIRIDAGEVRDFARLLNSLAACLSAGLGKLGRS